MVKIVIVYANNKAAYMDKNEPLNSSSEFDNQSSVTVEANLITGQLVTRENLDKIFIDTAHFSKK
ncbi:hypothetical protein IM33_07680 [Clostridioides difficile]|nr:hypothetical protein IM33_07680 [Clostridioides difficile]